jgi:hypothetical protein
MCEAFYSKSGQTSQISGKFCDVAFGFQNLKELQQTISGYFTVVQMEKIKTGSSFLPIKGLTTKWLDIN